MPFRPVTRSVVFFAVVKVAKMILLKGRMATKFAQGINYSVSLETMLIRLPAWSNMVRSPGLYSRCMAKSLLCSYRFRWWQN